MTLDKDVVALLAFLALCAVLTSNGNGGKEFEGSVCGFEATGGEEDE